MQCTCVHTYMDWIWNQHCQCHCSTERNVFFSFSKGSRHSQITFLYCMREMSEALNMLNDVIFGVPCFAFDAAPCLSDSMWVLQSYRPLWATEKFESHREQYPWYSEILLRPKHGHSSAYFLRNFCFFAFGFDMTALYADTQKLYKMYYASAEDAQRWSN